MIARLDFKIVRRYTGCYMKKQIVGPYTLYFGTTSVSYVSRDNTTHIMIKHKRSGFGPNCPPGPNQKKCCEQRTESLKLCWLPDRNGPNQACCAKIALKNIARANYLLAREAHGMVKRI